MGDMPDEKHPIYTLLLTRIMAYPPRFYGMIHGLYNPCAVMSLEDYFDLRRKLEELTMELIAERGFLEVAQERGITVSEASIREGLRTVSWPGRLDRWCRGTAVTPPEAPRGAGPWSGTLYLRAD